MNQIPLTLRIHIANDRLARKKPVPRAPFKVEEILC